MSKDQWIADHEYALNEWFSGDACEDTTIERLEELGFDPAEIKAQMEEEDANK